MRFFDDLLSQYKLHSQVKDSGQLTARQFAARMESPTTKRILFDSRQAALFAGLGYRPPQETQESVRPPLVVGGSGPEDSPGSATNLCRGFLLLHQPELDLSQVVMYFTSEDWSVDTGAGHFDAHIFMLDFQRGLPMASALVLRGSGGRPRAGACGTG